MVRQVSGTAIWAIAAAQPTGSLREELYELVWTEPMARPCQEAWCFGQGFANACA